MDEKEIAEKVAQNLPKSEPDLTPGYPTPETPDNPGSPYQPLEGTLLTNELMDYFNIGTGPRQSAELKDQMGTILLWARQNAEAPDLAGVLRTLRHTETILGSTLKPDRLARLYRYVRIQQQKSLIAEKERALYGA